jgi:hypothetical protein
MNIKNVSIDKVKNNKNVKAVDAPKAKRGRPALPDHLKKQKAVKLDANGNPVKRGRPSLPDHLKKQKAPKLDANGNPVKRGRPALPDNMKKAKTPKLDANGNPVKRGRPSLPDHLKKVKTKVTGAKRGRPVTGKNKDGTATVFEIAGMEIGAENMEVVGRDIFGDNDSFDDGIIALK